MSKLSSFFRRHPIHVSLGRRPFQLLTAGLLAAGSLQGEQGLLWWTGAPMAVFLAVTGYQKTACREKYLFVLYLAALSLRAAVGAAALPGLAAAGAGPLSGLLSALFLTVFVLYFLERVQAGLRQDSAVLTLLGCAALMLPVLSGTLSVLVPQSPLFLLFPSPLLCRGGILWIALGVGFSLFLESKQKMAAVYVLLCGGAALASGFSAAFMPPCLAILLGLPVILSVSEQGAGSQSAKQKAGLALAGEGQGS